MTAAELLARLHELVAVHPAPQRLVVALSGGRDSTVLLHALATSAAAPRVPLAAVHVNHGLQPAAAAWEQRCAATAATFGVPFESHRVSVARGSRDGREAAARTARYALFRQLLAPGDWLLTAHHAGDQAETLLMNLMRGSGVAGLAGIGEWQPFGHAHRVRPLLACPPGGIAAYARSHGLDWVEDPSNADRAFDRNYLRHEVVPRLLARWPAAVESMARSAVLAGEARTLLEVLADSDLAAAGEPARLSLAALASGSAARQRNLLRHACRVAGLPPPPSRQLEQIASHVLPARDDASPLVSWAGACARRYRGHLYLLPASGAATVAPGVLLTPAAELPLGAGQGVLSLERDTQGIDPALAAAGLRIAYRQGGEALKPAGRAGTHKLKKLLQEDGVVPWMRARIPLLYAGERLVAVADRWLAADCCRRQGFAVRWRGHAPLY